MKRFFFYSALLLVSMSSIHAMNILFPYDTLIRPYYTGAFPFQLTAYGETGFSDVGFNEAGQQVNVLQIWQCDQDALAMLDGFPASSAIGQTRIALDANDDGTRGHFNVCGNLHLDFGSAFVFRHYFCEGWSIGVFAPFYSMKLTDVCWKDLTKCVTDEDERVKELLTNNISQVACEIGCLDICNWKRTGPGDTFIMLAWFRDYYQPRPLLRNVRLHLRAGVGLPTGFAWDEDKIFAIPFGYDGAFSLPFGLGLDLTFAFHARVGFDVQLTHIFGNTRNRRIKTAVDQTELLLLEKIPAYRDFGLVQRFNLYGELCKLFNTGFSTRLGYQFYKQGESTISLSGNCFSNEIANTAERWKDWTLHQIVLYSEYDFGHCKDPEQSSYFPVVGAFFRLPFNGKRLAATSNVGVVLSVEF